MCLIVSPTRPHKYVAGYAILVWKLLQDVNKQGGLSPYLLTKYVFGEQMNSRIGTIRSNRKIYEGLHSFYNKTPAKLNAWMSDSVCPAIIPKGAEFYIGTGREVVSNQLIVYHPNHRFERIGKANFDKHKAVSDPRCYY